MKVQNCALHNFCHTDHSYLQKPFVICNITCKQLDGFSPSIHPPIHMFVCCPVPYPYLFVIPSPLSVLYIHNINGKCLKLVKISISFQLLMYDPGITERLKAGLDTHHQPCFNFLRQSHPGGNHRVKQGEVLHICTSAIMTRPQAEAKKADEQDFPEIRSVVPQTFSVNKYPNCQKCSDLPRYQVFFM